MKNILVTGVSRGLGLVIVETLIEAGFKVFGISRHYSKGIEELCQKYPGKLEYHKFDLANVEKVENDLVKEVINYDISFCGFINNAAIAYDDIITNLKLENLETMYKINVFSPMIIVKGIIRNMLFHNVSGSIVHISSISAHTGYKGLSMYASTKGALESFSKNVAREWGERGIRSNTVVVGFMETEMSKKLSQTQKERIYYRTALKKATELYSVAKMVSFLLSDAASSITGANFFVDSGTI